MIFSGCSHQKSRGPTRLSRDSTPGLTSERFPDRPLHCHIHLIRRRKGDVDNPLGRVRVVIPGKMRYERAADSRHLTNASTRPSLWPLAMEFAV
jgi:hypothetical protein